ncbi:MAG: helix-turn-helix domain-containing protein [Burkholderiaceae bacterium]
MNNIKAIRDRLGVTQAALAAGMGCTQGNVGHYEKGQTVPPEAAKRLIAYARTLGLDITFDDVYGAPGLAEAPAAGAPPAIKPRAPEPAQAPAVEDARERLRHA